MRELLQPHQPIRYRAADFLALWRCDESSGALVDQTGAYTATVVSGSAGAFGSLFGSPAGNTGSRSFASTRATAAGNTAARDALLGEWTISAWVRPSAIAGADRWVVTYAGGNTLASLVIRAAGNVSTVWRQGSNLVVATSTTTLSTDTTYHVVAVKEADPANAGRFRVRFYVDGQDAGSTANLANADGGTTSPQWSIGTDGSGSQSFNGRIDDLAVLRYAATAESARAIYARGASSVDAATVYASDSYAVLARVTVYTSTGSGVDLSSVYGWDLVRSVRIEDDVDAQGATADVEIVREVYEVNVAPLMATSAPNVDAGGALLALNRRMTIETATLPDGATADAAVVWDLAFDGFIASIDYAGDVVSVQAQDRILALQDVWIEPDRSTTPPRDRSYGTLFAQNLKPVEGEIQQLIVDNVPPTVGYVGGTPTLYTPTSPGWSLNFTTTPSQNNVAGQIDEWVSQLGWLCRYRWDDYRRQYRLTLYEPDRSKTTADAQVSSSQIIAFDTLDLRRDDIRNVCDVEYGEAITSGGQQAPTDNTGQWPRLMKTASDATSIAKYGRRYCRIGIATTSEINDPTAAQRLANAVVADLKEPKAAAAIELRYRHDLELGDVLLILRDGQRFSSDQAFAVVGVTHSLTATERRTSLQLRSAAPVARWSLWWDRLTTPGRIGSIGLRPLADPVNLGATTTAGAVRLTWDPVVNAGARQYLETEIHRSASNPYNPTAATLLATVRGVSSALFEQAPGTTRHYKVIHRDRTGIASSSSSSVQVTAPTINTDWIPSAWRVAAFVRQTTAQTWSGTVTGDVKLANMSTVELNRESFWDNGAAFRRFDVTTAGVYSFTVAVAANSSVNEAVGVILYKNGAATNFATGYQSSDGSISGSWNLQLLNGDYVEVYLTAQAAKTVGIVTIPSRTYVSAALLFAT